MRLFDELNIETQSTCNRVCPTCLRQSHPDKAALAGRFAVNQMPADLVRSLIDQAVTLGFNRWICLQHFNEPLQDNRIADFGRYARGKFEGVVIHSNGDLLTPEMAQRLDGAFDVIRIALYGGNKAQRAARIVDLFRDTAIDFTDGEHITTHHAPRIELVDKVAEYVDRPCEREAQMRCIIGYNGKMLLCCEDINGIYDLGNANDTPLRDLWFGERHAQILETLSQPGGRRAYAYCATCPRTSPAYWSVESAPAAVDWSIA